MPFIAQIQFTIGIGGYGPTFVCQDFWQFALDAVCVGGGFDQAQGAALVPAQDVLVQGQKAGGVGRREVGLRADGQEVTVRVRGARGVRRRDHTNGSSRAPTHDVDGHRHRLIDGDHGRMRLGPGTLYSSIRTLLEARLIQENEPREDAKLGGERRRYYRLTSAGRKLARSEAERLADLLRVARAKKILRGQYV